MIVESNGQKYYIDKKLIQQLSKITVQKLKKKDNNKLILMCGETGVGKSALSFQCSGYLDPNFNIDNISYTNEETQHNIKTIHNAALVFDEAFRGVSSRNTMNKQQKKLLEIFFEIRQLNQVIFLNSPSFFRLDEAIAVELSDILIYVYKLKNGHRAWKLFNKRRKNMLYYRAKKKYKSYNLVYCSLKGKFPKTYVINEKQYRKRKFDSLFGKSDLTIPDSETNKESIYLKCLKDKHKTYVKVAKVLAKYDLIINKSTIRDKILRNPAFSS